MLRFESEPACPSKLLIARCYSTIRARIRPNGFERILAHRIGCQRATASLSSRVASKQLCNYSEDGSECQHPGTKKFGISTRLLRAPVKLLRRQEIQALQHRPSEYRDPGSAIFGQVRKSYHESQPQRHTAQATKLQKTFPSRLWDGPLIFPSGFPCDYQFV